MTRATEDHAPAETGTGPRWTRWLDHPLAWGWCVVGWVVSSAAFVGAIAWLGGPDAGDAGQSLSSTWAIAHGAIGCAYPPARTFAASGSANPIVLIAPVYPLVSGVLAALFRVGHGVAFPSSAQLGPDCSHALVAIARWATASGATTATLALGYVGWLFILVGAVVLLRAVGRGRRGWEPATLLVLAISGPTIMPVETFFHPEDLVAVGLSLVGLAAALRDRWLVAGLVMALAIESQQFALLVAVPLFVVAASDRRVRYGAGVAGGLALLLFPLGVLSGWRVWHAALFGSSRAGIDGVHGAGGTWLWETHVGGLALLVAARGLPILVAAGLAWRVRRRTVGLLSPAALLRLVTISLALRLVFEVNLFGYYFMAVAVALVVLDVTRGRLRGVTLAWLGLVTVAFDPARWGLNPRMVLAGFGSNVTLPFAVVTGVVVIILLDVAAHRIRWYLVGFLVIVLLTGVPQLWGLSPVERVMPLWFWQLILVPSALALTRDGSRSVLFRPATWGDSRSGALAHESA